jgi:hypothetical protein
VSSKKNSIQDNPSHVLEGMPRIDRFHKDPDVWIFLISTLAGGTGLNLVGANKVVLFGQLQASLSLHLFDRIYRSKLECVYLFTRLTDFDLE